MSDALGIKVADVNLHRISILNNHRSNIRSLLRLVLLVVVVVGADGQIALAQESTSGIVLRDLTLIRDNPVSDFDAARVRLTDGTLLGWDQIFKAVVDPQRQSEFDALLKTQGLPLYRLRRRIELADWSQVLKVADPFYQRMLSGEPQTVDTQFMAALGVMRGLRYSGRRTGCVEPFLRAIELQNKISPVLKNSLADRLFSKSEIETQLANDLLPVWFDLGSVQADYESLEKFLASNPSRSPGAKIYRASLAIARCGLGKPDADTESENRNDRQQIKQFIQIATSAVAELEDLPPQLAPWQTLLQTNINLQQQLFSPAQSTLANQRAALARAAPNQQVVARLFQAQSLRNTKSDSERIDATLKLLSIPARWAEQFPTLSAAALYEAVQVAEKRGADEDARILRNELLAKYSNTYHGRLAKQPQVINPFNDN